ncbi:MAG: hypothetical protein F6K18_06370 [Okeania sp. SIO2C2]|uniref:hypothetical protein n=1 Tax=Okeania sp. SIO2C2 TaxID=2607787 RepID=UPI0013BDD0F5|nr:hypothetical protein [Okeania sp. SIO2C2]NEP86479.1 hypothetical protein [Okeania sp. SIO2C2]
MTWKLFNLFSKDSSKEEQKITPDEAKRLLAQFKKLLPDILKVPKLKEMITFDEAINYFQSDIPGDYAVKKGAIIRIKNSEWQILGQVFLDQNNQIICRPDGTSYGRQLGVRELDKKLLENLDGNNDILIFEMSKDEQIVHKPEVINVSDDVQLTVKGLPSDLPKEKRKAVLESLIRNTLSRLPQRGYNKGENIYQGKAKLNFDNELYDVFFSLDAIRVITALEIYKEAFDAINAGAREGVYDSDLAELAANHIKQSAWKEVQSVRNLNRIDSEEN